MFAKNSVSGLGVNVKPFYTISGTKESSKNYKPNNLLLIDVQFVGNQSYDDFLRMISEPKHNSLYLGLDSHPHKLLHEVDRENNSRPRTTLRTKRKDTNINPAYDFLSDSLILYNEFDDDIISAGNITKYKRTPIINIYKNSKAISFFDAMRADKSSSENHNISESNQQNFRIFTEDIESETSPLIYLVANPKENLVYQHSYGIMIKDMKLKDINIVKDKKVFKEYIDESKSSDMILNSNNWMAIMDSLLEKLKN